MVIDTLMDRYEKDRDYYKNATFLCKQICETGLEHGGIRAIVTSRTKRPDKLLEKVQKRNEKGKNYQSIEAIYDDIPDLAGVRIALYFPGDRGEVDKFITDRFDVIEPISNFPPAPSPYKRRFSGYSAIHYRVHLRENSLPDDQKHYAKTRIEIQVATVLMHAWSEVEHDLGYKPALGELSEDEYAILDEINGLVLAGEIALERLQRAIRRRVERSGTPFKNQYELATYLYSQLPPSMQLNSVQVERVDLLFRLLKAAKLNLPEELIKFIPQLDLSDTRRTVSSQLIDSLLADHPELYEIYGQILPEGDWMFRLELAQGAKTFLSRWASLEAIINKIAQAKGQHAYITLDLDVEMLQGLGLLTTFGKAASPQTVPHLSTLQLRHFFLEAGPFKQENLKMLGYVRKTRDDLIHETKFPIDPLFLGGGAYFITGIIRNLDEITAQDTRKIIDGSEEIQEILKSLKVISDKQAKKIASVVNSFGKDYVNGLGEKRNYIMDSLYDGFGIKDYNDILIKDYKMVLEYIENKK